MSMDIQEDADELTRTGWAGVPAAPSCANGGRNVGDLKEKEEPRLSFTQTRALPVADRPTIEVCGRPTLQYCSRRI